MMVKRITKRASASTEVARMQSLFV
eukprot:SAG31_NODE_29243_length_398_cov_1.357860_1_plen_24_part_01